MIAAHVSGERLGLVLIQPTEHKHAIPKLRKRFENRGEREIGALGRRHPFVHHDPVRDLDEGHADWPRGLGGKRPGHGVEPWQSPNGTGPLRKGAPPTGLLKYHHLSTYS